MADPVKPQPPTVNYVRGSSGNLAWVNIVQVDPTTGVSSLKGSYTAEQIQGTITNLNAQLAIQMQLLAVINPPAPVV